MNKELISVIVPVYGVEEYLPDCLNSLIHQTYEHLEIILVDDRSPDRSGEICDQYATKDPRIKVIHLNRNSGAAVARNKGIDAASGEYLFFADGDDWLVSDTIEYLLMNMRKYNADCCVGGCITVLEGGDGSLEYCRRKQVPDRCLSAREAMRHVLLRESAVWNRLYRRSAFDDIRFPEGRINEDEPVALWLYSRMERIVFLEKATYFYRKRKNSVTTSAFSLRELDCVTNSRENLEFVKTVDPDLIPAAEFKYIKTMLWCYVNLRKLKAPQAREAGKELHREIRKNRRIALRNPYLGVLLKVLAVLCAL